MADTRKSSFRWFGYLIATFLALAMLLVAQGFPLAALADESGTLPAAAAAEDGTTRAAGSGTSVLAFSSDVHNVSDNTAGKRTGAWIGRMEDLYGDIDLMAFGGDMGQASFGGSSNFWSQTQAVIDAVDGTGVEGIYTTGNHEFRMGGDARYSNGTLSSSSGQATLDNYVVNTEAKVGSNYRIYCLGSLSDSSSYADQITSLHDYLAGVHQQDPDNSRVIFIITHFPLHFYSGRTTANASNVIDELNCAVENYGQKIVFLWGHNHSMAPGETHYDEIFTPGYRLQWGSSSSNKTEIKFFYAAAGCMSHSDYASGSGNVMGKGLIVTVDSKNALSFTYYDENANEITDPRNSGGESASFTEQDPVAVTGVTINQASASVEVGRSTKLTVTIEPANATNKTVTWSSSDPSIARVDSSGRVTGVSEGTATITVTAGEQGTRAIVSDSIEVTVTPRSSAEQYFVIMIDDYALTDNISDQVMSNTSGYEYHGLETSAYDPDAPAPTDILWTLEEVDGVENGYYIRSYNGDYLSATYVRGSGNGYTGTLTVGDTQDVWVVTGGLENWQGNGSYLKSTNASDNPRPADIYLTTRPSNNSIDFFTVGSSSNYKQSKLVEPSSIQEPVAVTGIEVVPPTLEVEIGKSAPLTANVLPEDADDKTVIWTSSDESVATVNNNGRVRGVSIGTATITATTGEGGYTDTCEVTVTPSSAPGIGYVITIGDYAMSAEPSNDVLVNGGAGNQQYRYTGLAGVPYDGSSDPTEDILWLIEPTDGGYYIMSQDGRYLNATYGENETGGSTGALTVSDTPDVWTFEGTLEDWVLSGSTLHSANSGKNLTYEEGTTTAPLNLFTVRSTGESSSIIDPDNVAEVRFVETDSFSTNGDYIIAVTKDGNGVYAIENTNGTTSGNTGSREFTTAAGNQEYFPAAGGEPAYIMTSNTGVVWRYTSNRYLANIVGTTNKYLSRSTSGTIVPRTSGSGRAVTYDSATQRLYLSQSGTYYLTNNGGTFGFSTTANQGAQVRLFERSTVFNFKYVVQFVSNGVNYQSTKYAAGEVPVYEGETPTRAETELYTYEFTGWSSDSGATVYGPDDALPAVTGPVTYTAQFRAIPKPQNHTVTFESNGGTEINPQTVEDGGYASAPDPAPTKEGCYAFGGWYSDEDLTTAFDFENTAITEDITLYAKWNDAHTLTPHEAVAATCTEAGNSAYWSCSACGKFFSDEAGATEVEDGSWVVAALGHDMTPHEAVAATCTAAGNSAYWSCGRCGKYFSDEAGANEVEDGSWVIEATGHSWNAPAYEWAADHASVTATRVCANDATHVETETAAATGVQAKAPTCTEKGETTYTSAAFENAAFAVQTVTVADVDATGHAWGEPTYEWAADHASVTATRVCANDATHVETETAAATGEQTKAPTCTEKGETTYTSAAFENAAFAVQTVTVADIDATGHAWSAVTYAWAEDNAKVSAVRVCENNPLHIESETVDTTFVTTDPTCTEPGETVYTADFENEAFETQTKPVAIPATGHAWGTPAYEWAADHASVTATRTCANDATHVETETAAATGEQTKAPTCTEKGETTYTSAQFQNEAFAVQTVTVADVDATGHAWGEPTYEWADNHGTVTAKRVCANDATHVETETATATGAQAKAPTCTEPGETTYTSAAFENAAFAVQTVTVADIPAAGHVEAEPVEENRVEPTCTEEGGYDMVVHCSVCNEVLSSEHTVIPAKGHSWNAPTYEWVADHASVTASRVCANDATHVETETADATGTKTKEPTCTEKGETTYTSAQFQNTAFAVQNDTVADIDALGHGWDDGVVTTAPTCTELGVRTFHCSRCSETKTESIDPTGHAWNAPTYEWADDFSKVTATRICANDESHVETETVDVDSDKTVTVDPTDDLEGSNTYTSKEFTNPAFEVQTTVEVIPAKGHDMDYEHIEWTWTPADGGYTVKATVECKNDDGYSITEPAEVTSVTTNPTCTAEGKTVYTASVIFEGTTYTDEKTDPIPAAGHKPGEAAKENNVAPTCTEDGGYDMVVRCTVCGEALSIEHVVVEKTGHSPADAVEKNRVEPTCTEDGGYDMVVICTVCGEELSSEHTVLPATGHAWGDPTYTWAADNSSVTAKRVCANDESHVETETVRTTSKSDSIGNTTFTSNAFENPAFEVQTKKVDSTVTLIPIYRMYNTKTSEHLWTKSKAEYNACGTGNYKDWRQENIAWYSPNLPAPSSYAASTQGDFVYVWRLYDKGRTGDHIYLVYGTEMKQYLADGWVVDKGAGFWTLKKGATINGRTTIPIYRAYNYRLGRGKHHYTPSKVEYDSICKNNGWKAEGIKFYVIKK